MGKFKAEYRVEDGYVGNGLQYFKIDESEIEEDSTEEELELLFHEMMKNDFEEKIYPSPSNLEEFKDWAESVKEKSSQKERI